MKEMIRRKKTIRKGKKDKESDEWASAPLNEKNKNRKKKIVRVSGR